MRTYEEYHKILSLWDDGFAKKAIARRTGIPRGTVRDCIKKFGSVAGLEQYRMDNVEIMGKSSLLIALQAPEDPHDIHEAYSYTLGIYLGDGCISKMNRVYRIRISLDVKYPKIIERCVEKLNILLPNNKVGITDKYKVKEDGERYVSSVEVNCYYKYWQQVIPQDDDGIKHDRPIVLADWQQHIVNQYPLEFFRGLYHSDGSRSRNVVKGKNYPRYTFSNRSDDIRKLFTDTAEVLGLSWTTANRYNVAISRREDVAWLDEHIGAKA